jgi:allophanate hydrolase subunit 1
MNADLNKKALAMKNWFEKKSHGGIRDSIVAYNSLTLYYDPVTIKKKPTQGTAFSRISAIMREAYEQSFPDDDEGTLHTYQYVMRRTSVWTSQK